MSVLVVSGCVMLLTCVLVVASLGIYAGDATCCCHEHCDE